MGARGGYKRVLAWKCTTCGDTVTLPRGERRCPTDRFYVPTPGAFAAHVIKVHKGTCWCGFRPKNAKLIELAEKGLVKVDRVAKTLYRSALARHFAKHKGNLASHVMVGVIKEMAADGATKGAP